MARGRVNGCVCGKEFMAKRYQARGSIGNKRPEPGFKWEDYKCPTSSGWHIRKVQDHESTEA